MPKYSVHGVLSVPFSEYVEAKDPAAAARLARRGQKIHKHVSRVRIENVVDMAETEAFLAKLREGKR